jgi:hypothetical protein
MKRTDSVAGHCVPVYNADGRPVGRFETDEAGRLWLVKERLDPRRHQLQRPPAWATDRAHLEQLQAADGAGVRLHTTDGRELEAPLSAFERHGFAVGRGHGDQVGLALRYWTDRRARVGARQLTFALEVGS